nr:MAG TPA: hypothetical protein [Caudoviricetes sp.]
MATRQYVGARYVPKFANPITWNKENSYEALTIVTYLNNSYTSKKPVPANTEITNEEYWVVTGNYNGQVEEYRQSVVEYKNEVDGYKNEVDGYKNEVDGYKNEVASKQTKVYKKAIIVGDSWAVGYYNGMGHPGEGWGDYACPLLGVTSDNILTVASGGSGFINGTGEHFDMQIKRAYENYPNFRDADLILCVGGFNDAQDNRTSSELQTAAGSFFDKCKTYFPNAETHIFPLQLPYGQESAMTSVRWGVLSGIKQAYYNQTGGNLFLHDGVRRWANSFGVGASANDGSHLNQFGYNYMGQLIAMCVRKANDYYPTLTRKFDLSSLSSVVGSVITNEVIEDNGLLTINLTFEATNWTTEYIPLPDIASVKGVSYFYCGNELMVWNEHGIKPNNGSITGIANIFVTAIAGR